MIAARSTSAIRGWRHSPDATADERKTWETSDKNLVFTELHALGLADMDGDGLKDIVTGKSWWSQAGIPPEQSGRRAVVAWFKLVRKSGGQVEFVPHIINNYAGIGTQILGGGHEMGQVSGCADGAARGVYIFFNNMTASKERTTSSR